MQELKINQGSAAQSWVIQLLSCEGVVVQVCLVTEVLMVTEKLTETTEALEAMLTSSSYGCSYCFGGPPLGSWRNGRLFVQASLNK
jgi:hypothetical protein